MKRNLANKTTFLPENVGVDAGKTAYISENRLTLDMSELDIVNLVQRQEFHINLCH